MLSESRSALLKRIETEFRKVADWFVWSVSELLSWSNENRRIATFGIVCLADKIACRTCKANSESENAPVGSKLMLSFMWTVVALT